MNHVHIIRKTCKRVLKRLKHRLDAPVSVQVDAVYYASRILYKILYSFNVPFKLQHQYEEFIRAGIGIIDRTNITAKLEVLIAMYKDVLSLTRTVK